MCTRMTEDLVKIFDGPSDEEEFLGFGAASSGQFSEESRDSLSSQSAWKPGLCFRSKFITNELEQVFMDTDSEEEFEGFDKEESSLHNSWMSPLDFEEEEDSDDIGFYSDNDDDSAPQKRQSSGLCVAFRFPARRSCSTQESTVPKKPRVYLNRISPVERNRKRRAGGADPPVAQKSRKVERRSRAPNNDSEEEEEEDVKLADSDVQILSQRAKNIQENKAMLAKLFADLTSLPELSQKTTPVKKKKQQSPKKRVSEVQSERRNPSRKARPPEHFGLEQEPIVAAKPRKSVEFDLKKLMEIDEELRVDRDTPKRKYRKRISVRMPDDITEEELDNVADRAKDKILDKENGSTCHQCRQKTLDTKTECRNLYCQGVKGQFCGPCLRNRYGEDVRTALLDPTWECPLCRGICNCSLCRKRDGRCATGALTHLAKYYGYNNVKEYLESLQKDRD
ncbi:cell division cycle-associated 7-like protein [Tachysurus fulvidraco]|uniref:cell division cycle-associated 7-like protein n=1 Tax=Tachysurus fulvidraco TaxID=1234273 RepID=UPI000F4F509D|nr:cell division cycle-associated 7-like protein [Tachysurus fulvidraco]